MRFLVINGPNLNMLGIREPEIYGTRDYAALVGFIEDACRAEGIECDIFQSNHEGEIVDRIQAAYGNTDGIIINPAAYTHTSIAIMDALKTVMIPAVEVHISDLTTREPFRQFSYVAMATVDTVSGLGFDSYRVAIEKLKEYLTDRPEV